MITTDFTKIKERLDSPNNLANRFNIPVPSSATVEPTVLNWKKTDDYERARVIEEDQQNSGDIQISPEFQRDNLTVRSTKREPYTYKRVPDAVKIIAGTLAISEKQHVIAKEFGMSQTEVSYIERRDPRVVNPEVNQKLDQNMLAVKDAAMDRLLKSLGCITDDKLANAKVQTVSAVAANMARVVKDMSPEARDDNRVQIMIYSPPQKTEDSYQTVNV